MNESIRTVIYIGVAAVLGSVALAVNHFTTPKKDVEYARIGEEFYPQFTDPTAAQVLHVVAYNKDTASVKDFKVEYRDGKWRIPSHHNYPADGKDRLARTAASVMGTTRGAFVSRRRAEHARYDVVDPEDPNQTILTGRGQKIILAKNDDTVLADYIIGKKVEGQTDAYYVRAPKAEDADTVYIAKLKIDLSTKFSDWIEADLLKIDRENLSDIKIDSYTVDESQGALVKGEVTELTRKLSSDPWKLAGIKADKEELKTDVVNQLVNSLDGIRIVGVRPKPPGLKADLSLDRSVAQSQESLLLIRSDVMNKGFFPVRAEGGGSRVVSKEGELEAGTNEGLRYVLHFGQIFTGTEFEVETGLSKEPGKEGSKSKDAAKKEGSKAEGSEKNKDQLKKNRYLMVYAKFDPKLIGAPPTKPSEPKKPDSKQSSTAHSDDSHLLALRPGASKPNRNPRLRTGLRPNPPRQRRLRRRRKADRRTACEVERVEGGAGTKPADASKKPAAPPKPDPKAEYEKAMAQYKKDVERYENDKSEYEKKLKKGQDKVKELNTRFGPWYYVISAESFENLRLSRASLVKPKEKGAETKDGAAAHPALPGLPNGIPGLPK